MKRLLLVGIAVVLLLAGLAVWWGLSSLDSIVKAAVETYGSEAVGTKVTVDSVELSLTEGKGVIRGLSVANPPGFSSGRAFGFGSLTLELDLNSLQTETILVEELTIQGVEVRFEANAEGGSNLQTIQEHLSRSGASKSETAGSGQAPLLSIRTLSFEEGRIVADLAALGQKNQEVALPDLKMQNVGGRSGSPPNQVGKEIASAFTQRVIQVMLRHGLEKALEEKLGDKAGPAKKLLQGIIR